MKINKVFVVLLSLVLLISMVGIVSAEITTQTISSPDTNTKTATVFYGATQSYTITIPNRVEFTSTATSLETAIKADGVVLTDGKALQINVSSTHNWLMMEHVNSAVPDGAGYIEYSMSFYLNDDRTKAHVVLDKRLDEGTQHTVLIVPSGTSGKTTATFEMSGIPHTGDFQDTLSFYINPNADAPTDGN